VLNYLHFQEQNWQFYFGYCWTPYTH
jgi:hypothetical protein